MPMKHDELCGQYLALQVGGLVVGCSMHAVEIVVKRPMRGVK
jgi:hypothetical protein